MGKRMASQLWGLSAEQKLQEMVSQTSVRTSCQAEGHAIRGNLEVTLRSAHVWKILDRHHHFC